MTKNASGLEEEVGKGRKGNMISPIPNTLEVGISDSDWETASHCEQEVVPQVGNVQIDVVFGGPRQLRWRSPCSIPEPESDGESDSGKANVQVEDLAPSEGAVSRGNDQVTHVGNDEEKSKSGSDACPDGKVANEA